MNLVSWLSSNPFLFASIQRLATLKYRAIRKCLAAEGFLAPGASCLDIGCGPGELFPLFRRAGCVYLGVDISERYVAFARRRYRVPCFEVMDATDLSGLPRRFDQAISIGLFHHLSDKDTLAVLREVEGALEECGRYFVLDAIPPLSSHNLLGKLLRDHDVGQFIRHPVEYQRLFSQVFSVEKCFTVSQFPYDYVVAVLGKPVERPR